MSSNIILLGWNRSHIGCEHGCSNLVSDLNGFLEAQKQSGGIDSYQVLFPDNIGGVMNGFFLIFGTAFQLDAFSKSKEWKELLTRASFYLSQLTVVRGNANEEVLERMNVWRESSDTNIENDNPIYCWQKWSCNFLLVRLLFSKQFYLYIVQSADKSRGLVISSAFDCVVSLDFHNSQIGFRNE